MKQIKRIKRFWNSKSALGDLPTSLAALLLIITIGITVLHKDSQSPKTSPSKQAVEGAKSSATTDQTAPGASSSRTPAQASATIPAPLPSPAFYGPSTVLNLTNWKLALPIDTPHAGTPDEIQQPELATFSLSPFFELNGSKNGVIFHANVDGVTTKGSTYPRSELREMTGKSAASWSTSSGSHVMYIRQAITHTPNVKPEVVAGQIHDASDDVVMVRLNGRQLYVEAKGKSIGDLDPNYTLGSVFTIKMIAANDHIQVFYNEVLKVDYAISGAGYYFKAGCYTLSNPSKGDSPGAYGEVVIYNLTVSHS